MNIPPILILAISGFSEEIRHPHSRVTWQFADHYIPLRNTIVLVVQFPVLLLFSTSTLCYCSVFCSFLQTGTENSTIDIYIYTSHITI
jgi:hypothetical protein